MSTKIHPFCSRKFTIYVHENSATLSSPEFLTMSFSTPLQHFSIPDFSNMNFPILEKSWVEKSEVEMSCKYWLFRVLWTLNFHLLLSHIKRYSLFNPLWTSIRYIIFYYQVQIILQLRYRKIMWRKGWKLAGFHPD